MPRASLRNASHKGGSVKVSRIEDVSEALRAGGLVKVELFRDSAPINCIPRGR